MCAHVSHPEICGRSDARDDGCPYIRIYGIRAAEIRFALEHITLRNKCRQSLLYGDFIAGRRILTLNRVFVAQLALRFAQAELLLTPRAVVVQVLDVTPRNAKQTQCRWYNQRRNVTSGAHW